MPTKAIFLCVVFGLSSWAQAKPLIVTTTTTLADLVQNTVGPGFDVFSITKGPQDPHYVEAKPSFMVKVRKAQAVVSVGLELEIGWLPLILRGARNPHLLPGQPGYLDASQWIQPIEVISGKVDRSEGDIHGLGNPHYLLNPNKARKVVEGLSERFQKLFPENADAIKAATSHYLKTWGPRMADWKKRLKPGSKFISYHRTLNDFFKAFDLNFIGAIEAKPGIPPSARHILQLIKTLQQQQVSCILVESFFETNAAIRLQKSTQVGIAVVPVEVKATASASGYLELIETIVKGIENCRVNEVHRG